VSLDGIALVDKPSGITSHDAVTIVRRMLGTRKVGHAGTLDPIATGLLVIGVGRGTRLLRFFGDLDKTYEGALRLGVETDTLDAEGRVTSTAEVDVDPDEIRAAMASLRGESMQRPPTFSAVKVGGRKLYEAARRGQAIEAPPRPISVSSFDLLSYEPPDARFRVVCGGGTYVRALAAEVGAKLGCGAHLIALRRTAIGPLSVGAATPPDEPRLLPLEAAVGHLPRVELLADEADAASHGRPLGPAGIDGPYGAFAPDRRLIGIYLDRGGKAVPLVILAPARQG
jgi:tRNA pseudouridine55 synthase